MPSGGLELEASFWDGHEPNGNARPGIGARRGGGKRWFGGSGGEVFVSRTQYFEGIE